MQHAYNIKEINKFSFYLSFYSYTTWHTRWVIEPFISPVEIKVQFPSYVSTKGIDLDWVCILEISARLLYNVINLIIQSMIDQKLNIIYQCSSIQW